MANNNTVFVPQTFNGERMVSKRTPTPSSSTPSSQEPAAEAAASSQTTAAVTKDTTKQEIHIVQDSPKQKVVPIKPYAASQSVIDTRAKPSNTNRASISSSSKASPAQQFQQQQNAPIPVQPRPPQPQPQQQQQQQQPQQQQPLQLQHVMPVQVIMQPTFPVAYDIAGYERVWSEANVAVLIQLHRKHYNGVTSMDVDKYNAAWTALTAEYNAITADNRGKPALIKKWEKLMAKYNAERAFLVLPRPQGLQQPLPSVSYWNHFQYMDSYLSHVPIPENCILKRKRSSTEDTEASKTTTPTPASSSASSSKRPRFSDLNMELLETQRVFMEKTLDKQNAQIEMMKTNAESIHEMNMKFVNICEKACTKSQVNEERYLKLLEKCILKTDNDTPPTTTTHTAPELTESKPADDSSRAASPALSTYSSASSSVAKQEVEDE